MTLCLLVWALGCALLLWGVHAEENETVFGVGLVCIALLLAVPSHSSLHLLVGS